MLSASINTGNIQYSHFSLLQCVHGLASLNANALPIPFLFNLVLSHLQPSIHFILSIFHARCKPNWYIFFPVSLHIFLSHLSLGIVTSNNLYPYHRPLGPAYPCSKNSTGSCAINPIKLIFVFFTFLDLFCMYLVSVFFWTSSFL